MGADNILETVLLSLRVAGLAVLVSLPVAVFVARLGLQKPTELVAPEAEMP